MFVYYRAKVVSKVSGDVFFLALVRARSEYVLVGNRYAASGFHSADEAREAFKHLASNYANMRLLFRVAKVTVKVTKWTCECSADGMETERGDDGLERCVRCGRH